MAPLKKEKKWVQIAWLIIAVVSLITSTAFTYLWLTGVEEMRLAVGSLGATALWISTGLFKKWYLVFSIFDDASDFIEK